MSIRSMMKVIAATALFGATGAFAQFAGGNGQPGNPYQITDWLQLAEINNGYLDKHFILMNDLNPDMGGYSVGTNGYTATHDLAVGWYPLGPTGSPFTGSFDGDGYTINGLWSWRGYSEVGLFGVLGSGAEVRNVTVDLDSKGLIGTAPDSQVGGIAGRAAYATLGNVTVRGGSVEADLHAGGIVGNAINTTFEGAISNLCASVTGLSGSGSAFPHAGGIAGFASGLDFVGATLVNTAEVIGVEYVGGIFGRLCDANTDGTGATLVNAGGVMGDGGNVGGVIGYMDSGASIGSGATLENSGEVSGGGSFVGGVIGRFYNGTIQNGALLHNSGPVSGSVEYAGG
ncbi:MAG: hypothetical protein FWH21_08755, partial [Kiritimatiellaeota bacterium]|nr:hypothetical protein [Kiritimatiellota bacterium]